MKESFLNKTSLTIALFLSVFTVIGFFGFKISPAVTTDLYKINMLNINNQFKQIESDLQKFYCYSMITRQLYLRLEKEKYQSYIEIGLESEQYGALATYERAKLSLSNITNHLNDTNVKIEREGC
jgi:hypothetical protein